MKQGKAATGSDGGHQRPGAASLITYSALGSGVYQSQVFIHSQESERTIVDKVRGGGVLKYLSQQTPPPPQPDGEPARMCGEVSLSYKKKKPPSS